MNQEAILLRLSYMCCYAFGLLWVAQLATADDVPRILDPAHSGSGQYLPDFSYAGYDNGSTNLPTATGEAINVVDFGAIANDNFDDSESLLAAIEAANEIDGPVRIRFGPGRYVVSEVLRIERGDIVLQGMGSGEGGTVLSFSRPLAQVDTGASLDELRLYIRKLNKRQVEPSANIDAYFSEYSWSGGFIWVQKPGTRPAPYLPEFDPPIDVLGHVVNGTRGQRTLSVADSAALGVGAVIQLHWMNREGPDAAIIASIYDDPDVEAGSHHWSFPDRPLVRQTTRIVDIQSQVVTLSDPLLHDIDDELPARLASWPHLSNVGIEDLHLEFPDAPYFGHHMERGYNGIYLTSAFDSWVRNVRISNADSGILTYNSSNVTLQNIVSDGNRPAHYAVHLGNVHNVLAERVTVFNPVLHSLTFNTQSTKCVYKDSSVFSNATLDQHAGANHQNLFDNVTLFVEAERVDDRLVANVFDGSGAGYWQPGHGAFNTTWNLNVLISRGSYGDERVTVQGLDEGPAARIIGLHGNRELLLDYRPIPYVEWLNRKVSSIPSLYDFQRRIRLSSGPATR